MIADKNRIYDGWVNLEGGVDAGRSPTLIDPNMAYSGENITFRDGRPTTRPGWRKLDPTFQNGNHSFYTDGTDAGMDREGQNYIVVPNNRAIDIYASGIYQGALCYSPHQGEDCIMAMIGGRLFKIIPQLDTCMVTEIEPINDDTTPFTKTIPWPKPVNDDFQGIILVRGASSAHPLSGTTLGATTEPTEPTHPVVGVNSVWYQWVGVTSGVVQNFRTRSDHAIDIYLNDYPPTLVATSTGGLVSFTQTFNTVYNIRVRPLNVPAANNFTLAWNTGATPPPAPAAPAPPPLRTVPQKSYRNNKFLPISYFVQADKWLVIQDGESKPILFDGGTARRARSDASDPNMTEVPVGTIMTYGMGRICVVVNDRDIAFGDLLGSHATTDPADSLILFTERNFLAEGFDAAIPFTMGVATGAAFFPLLDTSTGNGQLMVFAQRGSTGFDLSLDRTLWQTGQFQTLTLLTTGLRGHRSIAVVNEDLWFRADDGYRSYRQARSEPSGWAHIPLSTNVRQFLDADSDQMLEFASAIYFDNRIIGTCNPAWNGGRPFHNGLVVVDFDILSAFGTKFRPAWDGHWTPGNAKEANLPTLKVCQVLTGIFNGVTRAFAFCMQLQGYTSQGAPVFENQLYEITIDEKNDWDDQRIDWELVTRAFDFKQQGNTPFTENELYDGDIWLSEIEE